MKATCAEPGCELPNHARSLCNIHYNRWRSAIGAKPKSKPTTREGNALQSLRRGGVLKPPRSLPYHVLARTCPTCGDLITTPFDSIRRSSGKIARCGRCHVAGVSRYKRNRSSEDETFRMKQVHHADAIRARVQASTVPGARNGRKEWTGPELEVANRSDLTAAQVAEMIGRTLYAVKHVRRKLLIDPRTIRLEGSISNRT